jgi:hypothetical protein
MKIPHYITIEPQDEKLYDQETGVGIMQYQ